MFLTRLFLLLLFAVTACHPKSTQDRVKDATENRGTITKAPFGKIPDGQEVFLYTLTNGNGLEMKVTNYGGLIISLKTPDRLGGFEEIELGYDSLAGVPKVTSPFVTP